mgnify:CR=1 FL=1
MPELYRSKLAGASFVATPGCYVTAASLALAPLVAGGVIDPNGVIVDAAKGYIVTNHHVIDNATTIRVQLADGRSAEAEIIGRDPDTDLALLKIDLPNLPVMGGHSTRIFDNRIVDNDTPNFAPEGNIVASVPVVYPLFAQAPAAVLFPACRRLNVGVIARVPFDDLGADDIRLVGGFADLLERLVHLHRLLQGEKPIAEWVDVLLDSLDDFCSVERTDAWQRGQVRRDLQGLVEASKLGDPAADGCAVPLSLVDVRALLQKALGDVAGRIALRSGSVTVTSMIPLHGVPARIVCILGLDSGSIRSGSFDGDDLLGQAEGPGEPQGAGIHPETRPRV